MVTRALIQITVHKICIFEQIMINVSITILVMRRDSMCILMKTSVRPGSTVLTKGFSKIHCKKPASASINA